MITLVQRYRVSHEPLRSERRAELVFVAAVAVLLLLCAWGGYRALSPSLAAPILPSQDALLVTPVNGAGMVTLEQRQEIQSRPLFWASRQPLDTAPVVAPAKDKAPASARALKEVSLKGVFGAGEQAGIIVVSKGKKRRLMVGDEINGWTLDAVAPTEVVFVDGPKEAVLALQRGKLTVQLNQPVDTTDGGADTRDAATGAGGAAAPASANSRYLARPALRDADKRRGSGLGLGRGDRSDSSDNSSDNK